MQIHDQGHCDEAKEDDVQDNGNDNDNVNNGEDDDNHDDDGDGDGDDDDDDDVDDWAHAGLQASMSRKCGGAVMIRIIRSSQKHAGYFSSLII